MFDILQKRQWITQLAGPEPVEDSNKYQVRQLEEADVRRLLSWTPEQIDDAIGFLNFPKPLTAVADSTQRRLNRQPLKYKRVWAAKSIETWRERVRSFGLLT